MNSDRYILSTLIGIAIGASVVYLAHHTPRARHEATVDHPTLEKAHPETGRRQIILRTGGRWM